MVPAKKSAPGSRREASTELMAGSLGDGFAPCDWDIYIYHAIISTMGYNVLVASCSNEPTVFLTDAEFGAAIPPACRMCFFSRRSACLITQGVPGVESWTNITTQKA